MIERKDLTAIGKFLKTHALKGELNAVFEGVEADFVTDDTPLIVDVEGIYVPFYCESIRPKGQYGLLIKLQGVDGEEEARRFTGKQIFALRSEVERWREETGDPDTVAYDDLIGCTIIDTSYGKIGEVVGLNLDTVNGLFIVETPGRDEILIPVADELIVDFDPEAREIHTSLPEGLIDIND